MWVPRPGPIIVDRSDPLRRGFSGPPTRDGSTPEYSLLKVLHSDPTSITLELDLVNGFVGQGQGDNTCHLLLSHILSKFGLPPCSLQLKGHLDVSCNILCWRHTCKIIYLYS